METINAWSKYTDAEKKKIFSFAEEYRKFISKCKTERECVTEAVEIAKKAGYKDLNDIISSGKKLKAGDKVFAVNMKKAILLFNIGKKPMEEGLNILGAHIDSPRIDVKQNPVYEDRDLVLFDTHYYGGIKKYQWVAREMAIHGVVALKNGKILEVNVGDNPGDPVFCVTDLLVHLAQKQLEKDGEHVVEGEDLNLLVGSMPEKKRASEKTSDDKEFVKKNLLAILKKKYGFEEKVYVAEIEFEAFAGAVDTTKKFKALPKFPAVTRDLAVIIDNDVPVSEIEKVINESCGKILEKLQLFDVYKGKQNTGG